MIHEFVVLLTITACSFNGIRAEGVYYRDTGEIHICSELSQEKQKTTLYHEFGHKIWFERFTAEDRLIWELAYKQYLLNYPRKVDYLYHHRISPGMEEDFAYIIQKYLNLKKYGWAPHMELVDLMFALLKS